MDRQSLQQDLRKRKLDRLLKRNRPWHWTGALFPKGSMFEPRVVRRRYWSQAVDGRSLTRWRRDPSAARLRELLGW